MYLPHLDRSQHVTVEAVVNGQQIINTFWLVHSQGGGPGDGSSTALLQSFRTAYRLLMARFYNVYAVFSYTMKEVEDVLNTTFPPERPYWVPVYNVRALEILPGEALDAGQLPTVGVDLLPAHEALRVKKIPTHPRVGYFKAAYNRFCPFNEGDYGEVWEKWNAGFLNTIQTALTTFNATQFQDAGTSPVWRHGIFSAKLHGAVGKPAGLNIYQAATWVNEYKANGWVGTQISRRFRPSGKFQGR